MSLPEASSAEKIQPEVLETQIAKANECAAGFLFGAQKLILEECAFATDEIFDRTQTEMRLFSEFLSKVAIAHSVRDYRTLYQECAQHQLSFIRRDCDRVLKHGERVIDAATNLFKTHPLN